MKSYNKIVNSMTGAIWSYAYDMHNGDFIHNICMHLTINWYITFLWSTLIMSLYASWGWILSLVIICLIIVATSSHIWWSSLVNTFQFYHLHPHIWNKCLFASSRSIRYEEVIISHKMLLYVITCPCAKYFYYFEYKIAIFSSTGILIINNEYFNFTIMHLQESFCECTQPMRDDVTSSLIGWVHTQNYPYIYL